VPVGLFKFSAVVTFVIKQQNVFLLRICDCLSKTDQAPVAVMIFCLVFGRHSVRISGGILNIRNEIVRVFSQSLQVDSEILIRALVDCCSVYFKWERERAEANVGVPTARFCIDRTPVARHAHPYTWLSSVNWFYAVCSLPQINSCNSLRIYNKSTKMYVILEYIFYKNVFFGMIL
jgi:hypothetical protein